ncbi:prolyl-tRNA synthetase associated domain-containing protein [Candidatus Peregrinibacteria bacterium]|nr:prolyl-tRNA synthetase associated domain-containing protein [Candidatus Peregrinibacteria bacterium]
MIRCDSSMQIIYDILKELGIPYIEHHHPAVFTCEEADEYYKNIPGGHSKNLFLRNRKGHRHYLVVVQAHKTVDLKALAHTLNESKLGFASPERMKKYLGVTPGSVTPLGLINDVNHEVIVLIDQDLWNFDRLHYHPLVNTSTLELSRDDFKKFLDSRGNEVRFMKL